jgi:hypothetical protein
MIAAMRWFVRLLGWILMGAALAALAIDAWAWIGGARKLTAAGELWYRLHPDSLGLTQAVTQRYLFPWLWDPIAVWILLQPAAAVLGVLGFLLAWLARR